MNGLPPFEITPEFAAQFVGPVDPALLTPPGTVVAEPGDPRAVTYEPAVTGAAAPIPYEKVDRTPEALQHLEGMTADLLGIPAGYFVCLAGRIVEHGTVALFGEVRNLGHPDFRLYRVVSYDSRTGRFAHISRYQRDAADSHYEARIEELS